MRLAASQTPLPSPVEAYFEVANRCNSKCATCPLTFSPQESARQLSLDEFKALVAQLPDLKRAVLQGIGEPLLNRDLSAMIAHLAQRGVYSVFNTNAALLTRRRQVELIDSGLDELRVSLDSSTPETYLKVRGIPAFERVVANVAEMVRTRNAHGSSKPRISIWMTALRENLRELPAIIDLAASLGVDEVYVQRLVYWGVGLATRDQSVFNAQGEVVAKDATPASTTAANGASAAHAVAPGPVIHSRAPEPESSAPSQALHREVDAHALNDGGMANGRAASPTPRTADAACHAHAEAGTTTFDPDAILLEAEQRALRHGLAFRGADARPPRSGLLEHRDEHEPWRACSRPLRLAYVTAQGTALPCCIAPFTDAPFESIRFGNYLRDGVESVWHGEAYQRFREQLYSSHPPASCRNCGLAWSL